MSLFCVQFLLRMSMVYVPLKSLKYMFVFKNVHVNVSMDTIVLLNLEWKMISKWFRNML